MKLSKSGLAKARNYLMKSGRKLERELYKYHFENGSIDSVITELSRYQGIDGGFMNLGEGDRTVENVMDTNIAFQILRDIHAPSSEAVVTKGIQFIIHSYDHHLNYWIPDPSSKTIEPYMLQDKWGNPCAELISYLYDYKELVPNQFLEKVTQVALQKLLYLNEDGWFAALCYLRLSERLEQPYKAKVLSKIKQHIFDIVETRKHIWSKKYCAKPYWYASSPRSALYPLLQQHVIPCLQDEIAHQEGDGNFKINWNARDRENDWKSIVTLEVLKALKNHQMIES